MTTLQFTSAPTVRQAHQAPVARLATDRETALDGVEQAHAFRIERMQAEEIAAGQEVQFVEPDREAEMMRVQRDRLAAVDFAGAAEHRRAVLTQHAQAKARRAAI